MRRSPNRPAIRLMKIGFDKPTTIELKTPLTHGQANFLHILGEFPNRFVSISDLCARLYASEMGVQIRACRVRKCLTSDWTIQRQDDAYRLIDLRDK